MTSAVQHNTAQERGSGVTRPPEPRYLMVGKVHRPHGVRGEVRVGIVSDHPTRLKDHAYFYLSSPESPEVVQRHQVEKARIHGKVLLLKLAGYDDRDRADELRGALVQIPVEKAAPLEEGEYYYHQLIGIEVETEEGQSLGRIVEVLETKANDVYIVHGPRGEVLIPAISDVVRELNVELGKIVVRPLRGMLTPARGSESE